MYLGRTTDLYTPTANYNKMPIAHITRDAFCTDGLYLDEIIHFRGITGFPVHRTKVVRIGMLNGLNFILTWTSSHRVIKVRVPQKGTICIWDTNNNDAVFS